MKKLIRFLLILVVGMILGYVFHDPIDAKLKAKFGNEKVENAKTAIKNTGKAVKTGINTGIKAGKDAIDTAKKN